MELQNPSNGDPPSSEIANTSHGEPHLDPPISPPRFPPDDVDSCCSTPYVSAPSSPGRGAVSGGYFFSAPSSPMHYVLCSPAAAGGGFPCDSPDASVAGSLDFEFSARFPSSSSSSFASATGSMTSADELFLNGQIRPMKLSSHLQRPQVLAPLIDLNEEDDDDDKSERHPSEMVARGRDLKLRSRSIHRRARSHSPLRNAPLHWQMEVGDREDRTKDLEPDPDLKQMEAEAATPSVSASSSRSSSTSSSSSSSSSSGRTLKKWIFLKDLLYRSKSEGRERGNTKEKFWHSISFSQSKAKSKPPPSTTPSSAAASGAAVASSSSTSAISEAEKAKSKNPPPSSSRSSKRTTAKPVNGLGRRRGPAPSPHERHYTANRAQAEEMRRKTFLPYRQGLLGCLGFSSRSYGAINGFARTLHPVSSQ